MSPHSILLRRRAGVTWLLSLLKPSRRQVSRGRYLRTRCRWLSGPRRGVFFNSRYLSQRDRALETSTPALRTIELPRTHFAPPLTNRLGREKNLRDKSKHLLIFFRNSGLLPLCRQRKQK